MARRFDVRLWGGIGVSLFFMGLLFRKIDFPQLAAVLKEVDYPYLAGAVVLTFASYFMRAVRWKYLLICERPLPLGSLYPATIIGYMANNLLPARLGELIRAYTLARREQLETPSVLASLVIDRLCDGFSVIVVLLIALFTLDFPPAMREAESALKAGGMVLCTAYGAVILFMVVLKRCTVKTIGAVTFVMKPFPSRWSERLIPMLGSFIAGIRLSAHTGHLAAIVSSSFLIWLFAIIPIDLVLRAFSIHLPFAASLFIMVLLVFAVMVPASPGYIGTYHYACFKGLSVFQITDERAMGIALLIHGVGFFPVILAGFYHLWRGGIGLSEVTHTGVQQ